MLALSLLFSWSFAAESENAALIKTVKMLDGWSWGLTSKEADSILKDLSQDNYFPYQDIVINGETIWKGTGPDCSSRYTAIAASLSTKYSRPFSVLDIGANNGYFSLNLVREFNSSAVMVDTTDRLTKICKYNTDINDRLLYGKKLITTQELENSSAQFDVILLLNVLHHMADWKSFLDKALSISGTVIVENPPSNDPRCSYKTTIPAIEKYVKQLKGRIIARTPRTMPGHYHDLTQMKSGMVLEVPTLPDVQSIMHIIHTDNNPEVALTADMFKDFNIEYQGKSF